MRDDRLHHVYTWHPSQCCWSNDKIWLNSTHCDSWGIISSGNGFCLFSTTPLLEPMLTYKFDLRWQTSKKFWSKYINYFTEENIYWIWKCRCWPFVSFVKSQPKPVTSGVPQGSVLGPLLFLVLIGDIDKTVASSFLSSFADDTRVGKGITSEVDIRNRQADLKAIYQWSVDNNMTFNSDKFELLRYKSKSSKELQSSMSYTSNNSSTIEEKTHVRDLGVTLSDTATFSQHIHEKSTAVKSKIAWVLCTFKTREPPPMLTLWKTQIMCHLDYCSQLWSPNKTGDIQSLELLQKGFLKKIKGMSHLPYWDQLTRLKLYSLERRQEHYQIIYTWRIIEGQVPNFNCTPIQSYKNPRCGRECRVPTISPSATCATQTIRFSSLPVKGPRLFNVLPKHLRYMSGCSTERFKGELDHYLEIIPDEPLIPGLTQYRRCDSNSVIDWAKSPYLHQQNNQLQEINYPELDEVVTMWWSVGFHEHYRVILSEWVALMC